jgi:hypothetical protein
VGEGEGPKANGMNSDFWQAITALGTAAGVAVVGWYAFETRRLRKVAQDQFEASIAPLVIVGYSLEGSPAVARVNFSKGQPDQPLILKNVGNGPAILEQLKTRTTVAKNIDLGTLPPDEAREHEYALPASPIFPGTSAVVFVPQADLYAKGTAALLCFEFEVLYSSTSTKRYRTFVKTLGFNFVESPQVEYGTAKANALRKWWSNRKGKGDGR